MANLILGFPIYSDVGVLYTPVLSGGSWQAALPLTNLQNRKLSKVARSTDDALTSTIVKVDLGVARDIRLVAIPKHNLSTAAKARVRLFTVNPFLDDSDFASWTEVGTSTRTTGQTDPFGGTRAVLLTDDDAGGDEGLVRAVTFPNGDGTYAIAISIREGSATALRFGINDATAGAWRHLVKATWTGGVPTLSTEVGSGARLTPIQITPTWWLAIVTVPGIVAANTNNFHLYGSDSGATGTSYFYEAMAFADGAAVSISDSGIDDAWPSGLDLEEADGINIPYVHILDAATSARYVRLEIADTANPDGFVDLARLIVAGGYQPAINASYGAKLGLLDKTKRTETDGGAFTFDPKPRRRRCTFALNDMEQDEAFNSAFEIQRRLGTDGQLFFVFDPADPATLMYKRAFAAVLEELTALEFAYHNAHNMGFQIVEDI